jgi:hypothetical protein
MKPIEPLVVDIDAYIRWSNRAGDYLESLMGSRENAISLLRHNEAAVRIAAIKSFEYCWYVDEFVVELLHDLLIDDPDRFVRCACSYCLMTMRLWCDRNDRLLIERIISDVADQSGDILVVTDLRRFLGNMRSG